MIATNFANIRNNFKEICNQVVQDSDIAIVTRKYSFDVTIIL